jgi:hypothetical protein
MGPLPPEFEKKLEDRDKPARIGYIHGMTLAMHESVFCGPWCTPYEQATGQKTIKMASCFACSTYMYANGFTPSSSHLGRAESWVPPTSKLERAETDSKTETDSKMPVYILDHLAQSLLTRWQFDISNYIELGIKYMLNAINAHVEYGNEIKKTKISGEVIQIVPDSYKKIIETLNTTRSEVEGGNLFLDALTLHDSEWKRIGRTLKPLADEYKRRGEDILDKDKNDEQRKKERLEKAIALEDILVKPVAKQRDTSDSKPEV